MVRPPCCEGKNLKKGPWTPEEDEKLVEYVGKHGHSNWKAIPKLTGLNRCGKSCRLRWTNYLRPDIKRGKFSDDEERLIVNLHSVLGNKWSRIATHLPGRTDNEIKNYWNTHIRKKLLQMGVDPITHKPRNDPNQQLLNLVQLLGGAAAQPATNNNFSNNYNNPLDSILLMKLLQPVDAAQLMKMELLQNLLLAMNTATSLPTNNHYTNMPNLMPQNIPNPLVDAPPQDLISNNHLHPENSDGARNGYSEAYDQIMAGYGGGLNINESRKDNTNKLPELVSASVSPADSSYGVLLESKSNSLTCDVHSPTSAVFEDWEKLLDEESFDAYWKEFLE